MIQRVIPNKHLRLFFIYLLFFQFVFGRTIASVPSKIKQDSSILSIKKPSSLAEQKVFSDKNFIHENKINGNPNWWNEFWNWIIHKLFGNTSEKSVSLFWDILIWLLFLLFIAAIIFVFMRSRYKGIFKGESANTMAGFTDINENINELDIDALIENALNTGDYRTAVRWHFLKALKELNKKNIIEWKPYKTNFDYYLEFKESEIKNSFKNICYIYEHVWYGETGINEQKYLACVTEFKKFSSGLNV